MMENNDLLDFVQAWNSVDTHPYRALEWILFIDKAGFQIVKKADKQ